MIRLFAWQNSPCAKDAPPISPRLTDELQNRPMDGVEAADQIRRDCDIPVIYLTAHSDQATLQRAKLTEPFGYILKPFDERELEICIQFALYKHEIERKLRESGGELRAYNRVVIAREQRMAELKKEVNELCAAAGLPARY